jgi:hypothetical protein
LNDSIAQNTGSIEVLGSNYPNFISQTLSRSGATTVPTSTNPSFQVNFDDGEKGEFFPL